MIEGNKPGGKDEAKNDASGVTAIPLEHVATEDVAAWLAEDLLAKKSGGGIETKTPKGESDYGDEL